MEILPFTIIQKFGGGGGWGQSRLWEMGRQLTRFPNGSLIQGRVRVYKTNQINF